MIGASRRGPGNVATVRASILRLRAFLALGVRENYFGTALCLVDRISLVIGAIAVRVSYHFGSLCWRFTESNCFAGLLSRFWAAGFVIVARFY